MFFFSPLEMENSGYVMFARRHFFFGGEFNVRDLATRRSASASATPKRRLASTKPPQTGVALDLEKQSTVRSPRTSKVCLLPADYL